LYGISETPIEEYDAAAEILKINYIPMAQMHPAWIAAESMVRANYSQLEHEAKLYQSIVEKGTAANTELQQLEKILDKLCASVRQQWEDCYAKEIKLKALAQEIKSLEVASEMKNAVEYDLADLLIKTQNEIDETETIKEDTDLYDDEIKSLEKRLATIKKDIDPNFENVVSVKPSFTNADFPGGPATPVPVVQKPPSSLVTSSSGIAFKPPQQDNEITSRRSTRRLPGSSSKPGPISRENTKG